ncbi:efflux RND transporter periplasmic adaptor subunit [Methylococcus sp. EFPC2]|uniref:efflux RND transporter periplasmic adaptor subunit n=1 Tax=Methylococcus sp. EFPC2 TaxID=2812648 RepID=UPI0019676823|nr:efflux RND transporter periplasmic adaptor subunit [Methylococcus sp. EFPC2]QSA96989.1 efflux RND transporter periplasmic adaptor subunit [Methylococcus sp. EFPC2]
MSKQLFWTAVLSAGLGAAAVYWPVVQSSRAGIPPAAESLRSSAGAGRQILYYKNPMGLADTSAVPKKDGMGMDYIPVYAEDDGRAADGTLRIAVEKVQKLGVKTATAERREIAQTVRSVGIVEADERRLYDVTLRFDGYIEKLFVNATGQAVARGQPLFELYSPDLVSAQREYLTAKNARSALAKAEPWIQSGMKDLADSSLERLRNWGISDAELAGLEKQGQVRHGLVVRSPASGVVMEKSVVAGRRASAGEVLFKIADLSLVWVVAEVYEQDIGRIAPGQKVKVRLDAVPGRSFEGRVAFVYPSLEPSTRTAKVRVELPNPKGQLKPMMYAQLELDTQAHQALAVPRSAVLEGGRRTLVLVDRGEGRFEPRPVRLGIRGDDVVEVLEGLNAQERVVVGANFLIDAESNLKAALGAFEAQARSPAPQAEAAPPVGHAGHEQHAVHSAAGS